jgi:hypothetical protein
MLPGRAVAQSAASGALLTVAVFAVYLGTMRRGPAEARSLALATLIIGYQILALVERAASATGRGDLLPRSATSWLVWLASGISLPVLMYIPGSAALLDLAPLSPAGWLIAAGAGAAALGWRVPLTLRRRAL